MPRVQLLMRVGTFIAALVGGMIGLFLVLPLGLAVHEFVIFPLALGIAALLAALAGGWTGTLLAPDRSRTRLMAVVDVAEATAAILAVLVLLNAALRLVVLNRLIYLAGAVALILALGVTLAVHRFRQPRDAASGELRLTLMLLGIAVILVPAVVYLASLFGLTGA